MEKIKPSTLCVYQNGVWKAVTQFTGWGDVMRHAQFRAMLPDMRAGKVRKFKEHSFKVTPQ
jgi:hypothetical protein